MEASPMITVEQGNLLGADVDALVNTVNTVGVMGKGIALQFKRSYPEMFKDYARAVKRGDVVLGRMHVWPTGLMTGPQFIVNFPTKGHWKSSSRISDIDHGLDDLVRVVRELGISSIAVPPLGCGHGGLSWAQVEPLIRERLAHLAEVDVHLYPPAGAPPALEMNAAGPAPAMSPGRAALVKLIARYADVAMDNPSLIEAQKLMYFLQVRGEDLGLEYVPHLYGPYSDRLRHAISAIEGHYVSGFGDGSALVQQAEPLRLLPGAADAAAAYLQDMPETSDRIVDVVDLVEGFESAYSLELLASVHWVISHGADQASDESSVVDAVRRWSERKKRMFPPEHILTALAVLRERGWIESPASVA